MKLRNARWLSRDIVDELIEKGDTVVDATAGNGYDTLYLAQKVGETGHVYAFDIQQAALDSTKQKLAENGCEEWVTLVKDSHANMAKYVQNAPKAVLFNLGWFPTGDHNVTTMTESTLAAVKAAMEIVSPGGMVSVCMYPGHEEGTKEKNALLAEMEKADIRKFNVLHGHFLNQKENAVQVILIQKENGED